MALWPVLRRGEGDEVGGHGGAVDRAHRVYARKARQRQHVRLHLLGALECDADACERGAEMHSQNGVDVDGAQI